MRAVVNKEGKRFGNLLVLRRGENHPNKSIRWVCLCDCGREALIQSSNLMEKHYTRSCGCYTPPPTRNFTHRLTGTPAYVMWGRAKHRAKKRGIFFSLEVADIVIPLVCPVLGIPIQMGSLANSGAPSDNSPSLDRFDPSGGYVKENVRVISQRANVLKNNATADELERIARWMRSA